MFLDNLAFKAAVVSLSGVVYWGGVIVQSVRVRKRIGRSPNLKPHGTKERLLWLGWLAVIAVWIVQPWVVWRLREAPFFEVLQFNYSQWLALAGLAMVVVGQGCTYWAYAALGYSWRIGIKKGEKTTLVTVGPYRRIRHPIYAFQILILLGAACLLPTLLSLLILGLHVICCRIKAKDEEAYLSSVHGETYKEYLSATGRFLPAL